MLDFGFVLIEVSPEILCLYIMQHMCLSVRFRKKYAYVGCDIKRGVTLSFLLEPKEVRWTLHSRVIKTHRCL